MPASQPSIPTHPPLRIGFSHKLASSATSYFLFQLATVFTVSLILFLILRSSDYLVVDGSLRAVQVYFVGHPFLHPNNHLLYAVNVYAWTTVLRALGIVAHDPFAFLRLAQAMNGFAAAACLTAFYGLLYRVTNRVAVSALATCGFGLCSAFLAHATNSAEPMVGLLWSILAVVIAAYGSVQSKHWTLLFAGLSLALAMATYQSMVLFGVPVALLLWQSPKLRNGPPTWGSTTARVGVFVAGFAVGITLIYGTSYYFSGTRTPAAMLARYLRLDGSSQVYGGVSLVKFASVLPGLAVSLVPALPRECGFRCLLQREHLPWVPVAALAMVVAAAFLITLVFLTKALWVDMKPAEKLALSCGGVGLLITMVPVISWMPTYDKLWLQPLACLFFSAGVLFNIAFRQSRFQTLRLGACILLPVVIASNIVWAASAAITPTPYLMDARTVAASVAPNDLVVGDWNGVFLLYQTFWAPRANTFSVPTMAEREGPRAIPLLTDRISKTIESGRSVFFLGILDLSKQDWELALGEKRGIAYEQFDPYRSSSETVMSFPSRARAITLRRLSR